VFYFIASFKLIIVCHNISDLIFKKTLIPNLRWRVEGMVETTPVCHTMT